MIINCTINGEKIELSAEPDQRVVDLLREDLRLLGSKEGCGSGECGSCTILVDGVPKLSCLMMAAQLQDRCITTIEGLGTPEAPHPVQKSFAKHGAVQCGYCTPGMVVAAANLLEQNPHPDRSTIRKAISGNLCRCTGYQKIVDAIHEAGNLYKCSHEDKDPSGGSK